MFGRLLVQIPSVTAGVGQIIAQYFLFMYMIIKDQNVI